MKVLTEDEKRDLAILNLATEEPHYKFAVPLQALGVGPDADAFERGLYHDCYRLIDVAPLSAGPGLFRIFRLTPTGIYRRAVLRGEREA